MQHIRKKTEKADMYCLLAMWMQSIAYFYTCKNALILCKKGIIEALQGHKEEGNLKNGEQEMKGNDVVTVAQTQRKVQTGAVNSERMERVMGTKNEWREGWDN